MRYRATVRYDGTSYNGWQIQPNGITIQEVIQNALRNLTQQNVSVTAAGRTDAGVHSYGQVFHFDCDKEFKDVARAINSQLPDDIRIVSCERVNDDFHSRFDAKWKHYRYIINTGEYDPVRRNHEWQLNEKFDVEVMRKVAEVFCGEHDFTSFNATKLAEMENQVRTIYRIDVTEKDDRVILDFYGNGFLRHMVRMLTGTIAEAGRGRITVDEIRSMLDSKDKTAVHYNAPACGLYLMEIGYDDYSE